MEDSDRQTLVEEGTTFRGVLESKYKVVVRGSVEGELQAPHVDVADSGVLTGNVRARRVSSQGVLGGTVEAEEVNLAGEVRNDTVVKAKLLEVKPAQEMGKLEVTFGDCVIEVGEMPARTVIGEPLPLEDERPHAAVAAAQVPSPDGTAPPVAADAAAQTEVTDAGVNEPDAAEAATVSDAAPAEEARRNGKTKAASADGGTEDKGARPKKGREGKAAEQPKAAEAEAGGKAPAPAQV